MKKFNSICVAILIVLLYPNLLCQTFTKITTGDIVNDQGQSHGSSWGDYDNDGDLDLFVANFNGENNFLYENNDDGTFTKITAGDIVNDSSGSIGGSWGDFDNDGDLDLFVTNTGIVNNILYENMGDGTFTQITSGVVVNDGGDSFSSSWVDYDNDSDLDLFVTNGSDQNNFLYTNNGDGTFTKNTMVVIANDGGFSLACVWGDYDNDGDLDLFVANGSDQNNFLYVNNGDGSFTKITTGDIVNEAGYSRSCSWGDYDNDGDLDLFVANLIQDNFLYTNDGDGTFTKITTGEIVNDVSDSHGSSWGDYDNDSDLDLFVANFSEDNFLYSNNGDGTFTKITTGEIVNDGGNSRSAIWGDYNKDGYLDMFVANDLPHNSFLYSNNGNINNWINIKCVGTTSNSNAIGTKLKIKANINGTFIWQLREVSGLTGFASQNSFNVEFGLGNGTIIDSLKIEWPSGIINYYANIMVNQFLTILEDSGSTGINNNQQSLPTRFNLSQNYPNPFNPSTIINYHIPELSFVTLKVYDVLGNEIAKLVNEEKDQGIYVVEFDATELTSGIYFYRLQGESFVETKKMVLMK